MGAPRVTYEAPKIEKDDSFEKYLEYQKDRETKLEVRAQKEREDKEARDLMRRQTGAKGLSGLYERTKGQLESGLIGFQGAQDKLQGYIDYMILLLVLRMILSNLVIQTLQKVHVSI